MMKIVQTLQEIIWGPPLLILLLGTGGYLMILLRGLPIRRLFRAISMAFGLDGDINGQEKVHGHRDTGISSFSSLATELAATMGTGNIIGVVSAMTLGGPGALVWMVFSSILGMATKLVESSLSVKYRIRDSFGKPVGGPMYTLREGFPWKPCGRVLAALYGALAVMCAFGMGNMVQANSISASLHASLGISSGKTGLLLAILTILVVLGGINAISGIATYLVPFMGIFYLIGCVGIILVNLQNLPGTVLGILTASINPHAAAGGIFGSLTVSLMDSVKWGVSRGVFSNEAGLGAAGISAAAANESNPIRQGFISMTGVFFDTIVICVITGIAYGCSGVPGVLEEKGYVILQNGRSVPAKDCAGLMIAAFETLLGSYGGMILSICITLFAFATILGWAYQGEKAFQYVFGEKNGIWFRFGYGLATFLGAVFTLELVWGISDICNGLLAIPNLICVLVLGPEMCREIRKYSRSD